MRIRARLYDADGEDRKVRLSPAVVRELTDQTLLWVDASDPDANGLRKLVRTLGLPAHITKGLDRPSEDARLVRGPDAILLTVLSLNDRGGSVEPVHVDLVAGRNIIVTIHAKGVEAIESFAVEVGSEVALGALDAATFLGALVDTMLSSFRTRIEVIEREIDELDEEVLRGGERERFLEHVVDLRRRTNAIRRILVDQREAFSPLTRPDFELHEELGRPWPGLIERMESALQAVDRARQLLLGSSDLYIARAAQRSGEVMRVLTIVSAVLLPAIVLAGIMGMNFQLGFFDNPMNFWLVLGTMIGMAALILAVARIRDWV